MNPNTFALIGAAGFVAPRHMKAIHDTDNKLVAALDPSDSVGIIDSYFPEADFFTEFERFDRHIDKLRRQGRQVDYISICSPNYLHDAHTRFALRSQAHAICEKPLVLNPWNIDGLQEMEQETGKKVFNILQLRLHPAIIQLKEQTQQASDRIHDVEITYITARGNWYHRSWKGQFEKSGGIATNIGVHFFDMLSWVFGDCINSTVHISQHDRAAGYLEMKNARVRWFLSVNSQDLPQAQQDARQRTYRSITVNDRAVEFSDGFTDLHTLSYQAILAGQGYGLDAARTAVEMVYRIRNAKPAGLQSDYHPFCNRIENKQST